MTGYGYDGALADAQPLRDQPRPRSTAPRNNRAVRYLRQMEASEALWGEERFDLMQIHNLVDWKTHLETLLEWKEAGRIRYIGVTTSHGRRHAELERIMADVEPCSNCTARATSYVIVKYHHHHRVEFTLCDSCAQGAEAAYSRKGGVLEVVAYPLQSEAWLKH